MKELKKKLVYKADQNDYAFQLKKRCKWCWLLLLLLLLLVLLIRVDETISYQVVNPCPTESFKAMQVEIAYNNIEGEAAQQKEIIDKDGYVEFEIKGPRLYEILFDLKSMDDIEVDAQASLKENNLISHHDIIYNLKDKTTILELTIEEDFPVMVVSKENPDFKIKEANLTLEYWVDGKRHETKAHSDSLGQYLFKLPICAEKVKLYGEKRSYLPDSIETDFALALKNKDKRLLKLTPKEYALDIVMCIDVSGSMGGIINEVKRRSLSFYDDLKATMNKYDKHTEQIRIRVITYHNGCAGIVEGDFCVVPDQEVDYKKQVDKMYASGGDEVGLNALALAFTSDFMTTGRFNRQIIVLISDYNAYPLDIACPARYKDRIPSNFSGLTEQWNAIKETASLLLMVPNASWWQKIDSEWEDVFTIYNSGRVSGADYEQALEEIAKAI